MSWVTCAKDGHGQPFFFCHGDYRDRGIYALRLADLITEDVRLSSFSTTTVASAKLAASVLKRWRAFTCRMCSRRSPQALSASVAIVSAAFLPGMIARQLKKRGRDIEWVVLIESPSLNGRSPLRAAKTVLKLASRVCPRRVWGKN